MRKSINAAIAVLLAVLLADLGAAPPEALGAPRDRLQQARRDLALVHERLATGRQTVTGIRSDIDRLNGRMTRVQIQVARVKARIGSLRSDLRAVRGRLETTRRRMERHRARAAEEAAELYKAGELEDAAVFFSSDSLSELNAGIETLRLVSEHNVDALLRFGRLRAGIERRNRALLATGARLHRQEARLQRVERRLARQRRQMSDRLAAVDEHTAGLRDREQSLAAAAATIRARIKRGKGPHSGGVSLRGFVWPLNGPITSPFGPRWGSMHPGIDIDGYMGERYVAAKSGRVISAGWISGYGNAVIISHGGGLSTLYGHSSALRVHRGQRVTRGEVIGLVGSTGYSTGSHLHFEVRIHSRPVDPTAYLP